MRTKFNNSELTHVWANQTQTHGKGSNIVSRIEKLETMVLELLTNERKKTHKKRTRR